MIAVLAAASCGRAKREETYIPLPFAWSLPSPTSRSVRPLPDQAFHVEWIGHDAPQVMRAGSTARVTVTVENSSVLPWPDPDATGNEPPQAGAVRLAYRWRQVSSPAATAWGSRADLERLLRPGQRATLTLEVTAPRLPGEYRLELDLVQEMAAFFGDKGGTRLAVTVRVV